MSKRGDKRRKKKSQKSKTNGAKNKRQTKEGASTPAIREVHLTSQKQPTSTKASKLSLAVAWVKARALVVFSVSLIGLVAACVQIYTCLPRFSVAPIGLLSPANAFSTQFEIANMGFMDARDLKTSWGIKESRSKIGGLNLEISDLGLENLHENIPKLDAGERATLAFNNIIQFGQSPTVADITLFVTYKIKLLPFIGEFHYQQRFIAATNYSGSIQWNTAAPSKGH